MGELGWKWNGVRGRATGACNSWNAFKIVSLKLGGEGLRLGCTRDPGGRFTDIVELGREGNCWCCVGSREYSGVNVHGGIGIGDGDICDSLTMLAGGLLTDDSYDVSLDGDMGVDEEGAGVVPSCRRSATVTADGRIVGDGVAVLLGAGEDVDSIALLGIGALVVREEDVAGRHGMGVESLKERVLILLRSCSNSASNSGALRSSAATHES